MDFGKPCTYCGECCKTEPCQIAIWTIGEDTVAPCPALEKDGNLFFCGLMRKPSKYIDLGAYQEWKDLVLSAQFKSLLGAGMGCCSER